MAASRRACIIWAVLLILAVILGATPLVCCSAGEYDGHTWELIQAFSGALRNQEERNQNYLLPLLALVLLLLGTGMFWFRIQKKPGTPGRMRSLDNGAGHSGTYTRPGEKQRAWLRVALNRDMLYAQGENGDFRKGRIINISGGGLLFAAGQKLKQNDELKIVFELSPGKELNLTGRVVRVTEKQDSEDCRFLIGVEFIKIRSGEQESIVREIFQRQQEIMLEERRKAKGECVLCGKPLPEGSRGVSAYCPKCRP